MTPPELNYQFGRDAREIGAPKGACPHIDDHGKYRDIRLAHYWFAGFNDRDMELGHGKAT